MAIKEIPIEEKSNQIFARAIKTENQSITCSNPKCKRIFAHPIIVSDLSSKNPVSYSACPYCLTEIVIEKTKTEKVKAEPRQIERIQEPSRETYKCQLHFGYLSQRSSGEEIPEECLTCEKMLKCILSKPKIPKVVEQMEKIHVTPLKSNSFTPEKEPEIKTEPLPTEPSGNSLKVENLGMLYASWSNTVRINRQTLSGWGEKIREVELETVSGKRTRCKVQPMEDSKKDIIQIPDKMQLNLEIGKGELVRVKPVIE